MPQVAPARAPFVRLLAVAAIALAASHGPARSSAPSSRDELARSLAPAPTGPGPATAGLGCVVDVAAGGRHSLALQRDGTVLAWGGNEAGQLGDGTTAGRPVPAPLSGVTTAIGIAAGGSHSLALLEDGTVLAWGDNGSGQLGDGTYESRAAPAPVAGVETAVAVAAGRAHSLALLADGQVLAWGDNGSGQLGDGTRSGSATAVRVGDLPPARAVAAGRDHGLALLSDGRVAAWGANGHGQLGTQEPGDRLHPGAVHGTGAAVAVAAVGSRSLALLSDGTTRAWGLRGGVLGDELERTVPRLPVGPGAAAVAPEGIVRLTAGTGHALALASDHRVLAWGANESGQLGTGDLGDRAVPEETLLPSPCAAAGLPPSCFVDVDAPSCGTLVLTASAVDPDGDPVTFAWSLSCAGPPSSLVTATVLGASGEILQVDVEPPCDVTCTATLVVDDGTGESCVAVQPLAIDDEDPPVLSGVPEGEVAECGAVPPPAPVTASDACSDVVLTFTETIVAAGTGCADGQREGFVDTVLYPDVAGCSAGWSEPGVMLTLTPSCALGAGDDGPDPLGLGCNVADACAPGWRVAEGPADVVAALGGAPITGATQPGQTLFFVTRQSGTGCGICATGTLPCTDPASCASGCEPSPLLSNDLFGVGSLGAVPDPASCGILNRFSHDQCSALGSPWSCPSVGGITEAHTVVKTGPALGGVLCVRELDVPPCPSGVLLERRWTATDACGNSASAIQTIVVNDTTPPDIVVPAADATVECDGAGNAAELAAWLSARGGALAADACGTVTWSDDFAGLSDDCGATGETEVTFTAVDECGNAASTTATFRIVDTTPPAIDVTGAPAPCLWPPNHRLVCLTLDEDLVAGAFDACSGAVAWRFAGCASSQPDDGLGDGHTEDDCVASPDGRQVCVRSERAGSDPAGRTYALLAAATDDCDLETVAVVLTVHVPHDQSPRERDCLDAAHVGLGAHDPLPWEP